MQKVNFVYLWFQIRKTSWSSSLLHVCQTESKHRRDVPGPNAPYDATRGRGRTKIINAKQRHATKRRGCRRWERTEPKSQELLLRIVAKSLTWRKKNCRSLKKKIVYNAITSYVKGYSDFKLYCVRRLIQVVVFYFLRMNFQLRLIRNRCRVFAMSVFLCLL